MDWEVLRKEISERINIPEEIIDLISVEKILQSHVNGLSKYTISNLLDIEIKDIEKTLMEFFASTGLEIDLDISPYFFYKRSNNNVDKFVADIFLVTQLLDKDLLYTLFSDCLIYSEIERKIEEHYV